MAIKQKPAKRIPPAGATHIFQLGIEWAPILGSKGPETEMAQVEAAIVELLKTDGVVISYRDIIKIERR